MNELLRIAFAVVVGVFVYAMLKWLASGIPQLIDVLVGVIAAFIAYFNASNINWPTRR